MRRLFVAGNWKMHGSRAEARVRAQTVAAWAVQHGSNIDIALFPPAPHLTTVLDAVAGSAVRVGAQDVHCEPAGAFTGDVSAEMIVDLGGGFALVGHSERRQGCGETDVVVAAKAAAALRAGLTPLVCVGESLAQRRAGSAQRVVRTQLDAVIAQVGDRIEHCMLAYEPVWAIGTGEVATPAMIADVHRQIRALLGDVSERARAVKILYGGSVNAGNAQALFAIADVDGGLVGGASLIAEQFLAICAAAEDAR